MEQVVKIQEMEKMKLTQLLRGLDVVIKGNKEVVITGLSSHSQFVSPGSLFIAKKGKVYDGSDFIPQALAAGAVAILTDMYNPFFEHTVQVISSDIEVIEAILTKRYYGDPSASLFLVGITGTNGKTITAYLVRHLLGKCGLMGTIENIVGKNRCPTHLTTSDLVTNYKWLRKIADQNMKSAVMEITSHALDQGRVRGMMFDVGVFTNFSQDHLDYHGSMETYLAAKMAFFKQVKCSVFNSDEEVTKNLRGISYAIESDAMLRGTDIEESLDGTQFNLHYRNKVYPFTTQLVGRYNVYNCLAAIAVALHRGYSLPILRERLATFEGVSGRLEPIPNVRGIHIFVDFAHTPKALATVLCALKRMVRGKIITIFGCGGDRDQDKRPKMAKAVEQFSDHIIVTSDNPRTEDPMQICHAISRGLVCQPIIEVDRRCAIRKGISVANKGDVVLIAGRGHESFQNISGKFLSFDDREVVREMISAC